MKYGFIGCGNMGSAIAKSLSLKTKDIILTDRSGKAAKFAAEIGCLYADNQTVVSSCDRIFLAVKPQMMSEVLLPLQRTLQERKPLLITMAAGLSISRIEEFVGTALPIIRIMPNTPVLISSGMTLYTYNNLVSSELLTDFLSDVSLCGQWDYLDESLIDAAGVISGCGPAYMYQFMEALVNGAAECGVSEEKAIQYATASMIGAAKMVQQTGLSPAELRNAVCSPGGSTLAGLKVLNDCDFSNAVSMCVCASFKRNQELGK